MARVAAVIGGGISGLGAAHALSAVADTEVVLFEAGTRWGGKILTGEFRGRRVDLGPDNFLTRNARAAELCEELGIGGLLTPPSTSSAAVLARGRLQPLPSGLILGLAPDLGALARSRIVSARGLARASLDLVPFRKPISPASLGLDADPGGTGEPEWSAGSILSRRLGRELVERLVDPLLGGINAGGVDQLSLRVVAPQVAEALAGRRSVTRALRGMSRRVRKPAAGGSTRPFFLGMKGGLGTLPDALAERLLADGVDLRAATEVTALRRAGRRFELDTTAGAMTADAVVLAAPAFVCARLLADELPVAAAELGSVPHSSVSVVTFAFSREAVGDRLQASGFLVPRTEALLITGCTFLSAKWPETAGADEVVLRASTGRYGDDRQLELSDGELASRASAEIRELLGIRAEPLASLVQRWPRSFPQYLPGHLPKVARVRAELAQVPGLAVAGPVLGGIGIPSCLSSGEEAAREILESTQA